MTNVRLSRGLCAVVASVLSGSHATLDRLFSSAGAPGEPPDLSHESKWKQWLFLAGQDRSTDSLSVLGSVLEEFMDVSPVDKQAREEWLEKRKRVVEALETDGLRYYQGGRVLPNGRAPEEIAPNDVPANAPLAMPR